MDVDAGELETTFKERLKQVIRSYGSANSLAGRIGRSEGALRNWVTGKSEPSVSNVVAICRETRTRVEWLIAGRGPRMEPQVSGVREETARYTVNAAPDERLLRSIIAAIEQELNSQNISLLPAKKTELIVNCYQLTGSMDKFDASVIARLVKLAL